MNKDRQKPQPKSEWDYEPSPSHSEECTKLFWEWKECHKNNSFFKRNFMGVCERKGIAVDRCLKAEYDAKRDASVNKPKRREKKKQKIIEDDEKKLNGDS